VTETVLTVVTATVPAGSEDELQTTFRLVTDDLPPEVLQTFLVRGEANDWSVISVWRSRADLDQYLDSVETQGSVELFRTAGGDPTVSRFDVLQERHQNPTT
jgi:hypothetical protein